MKTLQECKEEIAIRNEYSSWKDAEMVSFSIVKLMDEAAELYASQYKSEEKELIAAYKEYVELLSQELSCRKKIESLTVKEPPLTKE